jgi:hypothetical protein
MEIIETPGNKGTTITIKLNKDWGMNKKDVESLLRFYYPCSGHEFEAEEYKTKE